MSATRPPYRAAAVMTLVVLAGYGLTLAPSVTFWDAGEFIAASRVLGIPHPPGTPLFVMMAHVWGLLAPLGEYAFRINLLSAMFSAAGAGCLFLVVHEALRDAPPVLRLGGATAGIVLGAFSFTHWQNSNETEVYAVATFTIAAMAWLALLWRRRRRETHAPRLLLLVVYLAGLSIGTHLLALLAGPAILAFVVATLREEPADDEAVRRAEWGEAGVLAGVWALLVGTGLGSTRLALVGVLCFAVAAGLAARRGAGGFAVASLAVALVGVTPYLYLYLRAAQHPPINEAAPATLDALLAVVRRAQYPPRTPLDDPTLPSGPGNPGRTLGLLGIQLGDYLVYGSWQWARSSESLWVALPVALAVGALALRGLRIVRRTDRPVWWLLLLLFLVTGLGLVAYMNFKPGAGRWYDLYLRAADHEVRERDYFFVVSFIVWGTLAGVGLASLAGRRARAWAPVLMLALVPVGLNAGAASRRHGADARLPGDFAYDLLNSVPPYGILFTYGDNDTFPLWWAQEVEGTRRDVTVICLSLANTDWYMRQLRDGPARPLDQAGVPPLWRHRMIGRPEQPLHAMSDSDIRTAMNGYLVRRDEQLQLGPVVRTLRRGSFLYPNELLALAVIRQNLGRRPLVWAVTAGRTFAGLGEYVVQRGLGFELLPSRPDTTDPGLDLQRLDGVPLDVPTTADLVFHTYRYAGLLARRAPHLESTAAGVAASLALPPAELVYAYHARRERDSAERALAIAARLSPGSELATALRELLSGSAPDSVATSRRSGAVPLQ